MANYNSPFVKKVWFYSQKVLPLVFDNSLSYYEALAHFAHKVNEIINTVNNQTMHMTEWEKEIALAMEVFEQELRQIQADFEEEMEGKWSDFKAEMLAWKQDIDEDWTVMQSEFSALENLIQQQIENLAADYTQYKADLTAQQSAFETAQTARQSNFETAQTNRQAAFEQAQTTRQTNYENNLTGEWEDFQEEIPTTIDNEINTKVKYFESPFGALSGLQSDPPTIPSIAGAAFDFNSNIVRAYSFNRVTGYDLIKRCRFGDLATDQDIPAATTSDPILIIFENPAVAEYFKAGITMYGSRNASVSGANVVVRSFPEIAKTTSLVGSTQLAIYTAANDTPGVPQPMTPTNESYPATPSYDYIGLQFFAVNYDISITQPTGATTKLFPGFIYDAFSGGVIRDPELVNLLDNIIPFVLQRGEYTLNDQSALTFDTLSESKYYRYTASAIGNPVSGAYGIIVNIRFTAYAVQLLFSQTTATAPTQLLYRLGTDMNTTPNWRAWQTVGSGGSATITTLWSDSNGAQLNIVNTLTQSINDFDVIYLKCGNPTDISVNNNYSQISFIPAILNSGEKISGEFYKERYFQASFSGNTFTITSQGAVGEASGYTPTIYNVVGVKF